MSKKKLQNGTKLNDKVEQSSIVFRFANYALFLAIIILDAAFHEAWDPPEYFYIVILGVIVGADGKALYEKVASKK